MIDTFTDTAGTLLSAHTPDGGGSWSISTGGSDGVITASNTLRPGGASATGGLHSATPPSANYSVYGKVIAKNLGVDHRIGVAGRMVGDDRYSVHLRGLAGTFRLMKNVGGVGNQLAVSSSITVVNEGVYAIELRMSGSTLEGYVDGVLKLSATDTDLTAAGNAGVALDGSGTISDSTLSALDDFNTSFGPAAAGISGTALVNITESDIVAGGKTIVISLSGGAQWIPS